MTPTIPEIVEEILAYDEGEDQAPSWLQDQKEWDIVGLEKKARTRELREIGQKDSQIEKTKGIP